MKIHDSTRLHERNTATTSGASRVYEARTSALNLGENSEDDDAHVNRKLAAIQAHPRPVGHVNRDYALSHTSGSNETTHETRSRPHPYGVTCFVHASTSIQVNSYRSHTITRTNEREFHFVGNRLRSSVSTIVRNGPKFFCLPKDTVDVGIYVPRRESLRHLDALTCKRRASTRQFCEKSCREKRAGFFSFFPLFREKSAQTRDIYGW